MKTETMKIFEELPAEIGGYKLNRIFAEEGDKFFCFSYDDEINRRSFAAYFHKETAEYKVRVKIGLTEFCLTKFFTGNLEQFAAILNAQMPAAIKNLAAPADTKSDVLIAAQNFSAWEYAKNLPKNLEGFELFIAPAAPAKITNGSYIILNYSDFDAACDFTIFYNVYTDSFCGESKINLVPNVSYLFDAANLKELEPKLQKNLAAELCNIRKISRATA